MKKTFWKDNIKIKFTDNDGRLTLEGISYLEQGEHECLEDALKRLEVDGHGWWFDSDLNRADIHYSGSIGHLVKNL